MVCRRAGGAGRTWLLGGGVCRRGRHRTLGRPAFGTVAFPGALALSALLGALAPSRAWAWGGIVMMAQVPVVIVIAGPGPLVIAGLLYAAVLAVPAALVSWGSGALRERLAQRGH